MKITKSFTADAVNGEEILIYGAGRYGELALRGLQAMNLEPYAFVDRTYAGRNYLDVKVIAPEELRKFPDAIVLIASYNYFFEMLAYLQSIGHERVYDMLELLKLDYDESVLSEYTLDEKHNYGKYQSVITNADVDGVVITHCELVVTECCSLKCRDCANLMQYYQHPENLDVDDMIDKFGRFLESIDMLLELRILGGEPFICRDLDKVIHAFLDHDKVKRITIYTNSTIIPSDTVLDALKNPKVSVHMSNYGMVSRNVEKLDKIFTENGINHYIHVYDQWSNLGGLDKRNYCAERLNAIKNAGNEFVDFNCTIDNRQKRQALKALIENTEYIQRVIIAMAPRQDVNR